MQEAYSLSEKGAKSGLRSALQACHASFQSTERGRTGTTHRSSEIRRDESQRGVHVHQRFWGIASSARGERLLRLRSRKRSWSGTLSNLSTHMSQKCRRFCKKTYPIYPRIRTQRGDNSTCHCVSTRSGEFFKQGCVAWFDH